jgi:hypothetical protein
LSNINLVRIALKRILKTKIQCSECGMTEVKWQSNRSHTVKGFFEITETYGFISPTWTADGQEHVIHAVKFLQTLRSIPVSEFGLALMKDEMRCGTGSLIIDGGVPSISCMIQCRGCKNIGEFVLFDLDKTLPEHRSIDNAKWVSKADSQTKGNYALEA